MTRVTPFNHTRYLTRLVCLCVYSVPLSNHAHASVINHACASVLNLLRTHAFDVPLPNHARF